MKYRIGVLCLAALLVSCEEDKEKEEKCVGRATQCDELDEATCEQQNGCHLGKCGGTATPCSSIDDWQLCLDQEGCTREGDRTTGWCTGTAAPCDDYGMEYGCSLQDGCEWLETECGGSPSVGCEGLSENVCVQVLGCSWE